MSHMKLIIHYYSEERGITPRSRLQERGTRCPITRHYYEASEVSHYETLWRRVLVGARTLAADGKNPISGMRMLQGIRELEQTPRGNAN